MPLIDVEQERPTICYVNAPFFFRILIKINGIGEMLWLRRCHSKAIDGHGTPLFIEKHVNAAEIFHGFKASLIFWGADRLNSSDWTIVEDMLFFFHPMNI